MTTNGYTLLQAPRPAQALVHIHAGAEELGRVYAADLAVHSSMVCAATALAALEPPATLAWAEATSPHTPTTRPISCRRPVAPLDMAEVVKTLARLVPESSVFTNGAGNFSGWLHRFCRYPGLRHAGRTQLAPTSGAMGYGFPAAVAASLLQPERTVINIAGDGDFLMTSQEMATAISYGAGTGKGALVVVVVDNGTFGTIRMHQEREYPGRVSGSDIGNPDFAALARAYGWWASARIDATAGFEPALREALGCGRPALIHLRLDADVITSRTTLTAIRAAAEKRATAGH